MPLQDQLAKILALQQHYAPRGSVATTERNRLVQEVIPVSLRQALRGRTHAIGNEFLHIYGSGAAGLNAKVPWVLVSDNRFTTSAQDGWYLVLLFSEDGSGLDLSLNKNSTVPTPNPSGKWAADPLPDYVMKRDRDWALSLLEDQLQATPLELRKTIDLHTTAGPGRAYEKTHVVGRHYPRSALPEEDELVSDLAVMSGFLAIIYNSLSGDSGISERPVSSSTEGAAMSSDRAGVLSTSGEPGRQSNTPVKLATEKHAVEMATEYLEGKGYQVEDVGAVKSYDLRATRGDEILCVEVKGSVERRSSVSLTYNEVQVARNAKHTLLIVVDQITWKHASNGGIETFDGNLRKWWGWKADEDLLTPTEYRYELPPEEVDKPTDG